MNRTRISRYVPQIIAGCMMLSISMVNLAGAQETFKFTCGITRYEGAYAGAKANIATNTKVSGGITVFHAGTSWDQVWVRDGSYSIQMACGLLDPTTSKGTFNSCTSNWNGTTVAMQDACGHFGGWPALTDGIVWATGAWEFYCITGDRTFLTYAYPIVRNSLLHAETEVLDRNDGLFKGCASFMESNSAYPGSFANNGGAVGATKAMSTNALHYNAYLIAAKMGRSLSAPATESNGYDLKAKALKDSLNKHLWLPDSGFYGYFRYANGTVERKMEALGEAFAVMYGIADGSRRDSVFNNTFSSSWGIQCLYPQYQENGTGSCGSCCCYHNGYIWPFTQGYWAWAASMYKKTDIFFHEFDKLEQLYRKSNPGEFWEFYNLDGGPAGSGNQLWSAAGYLSMVYHGLFGMNFEESGIRFDPLVPPVFADSMTLTNISYRGMTLNITVKGNGTGIQQFLLDGSATADPVVPGNLTGSHSVRIVMTANPTGTTERIAPARASTVLSVRRTYRTQGAVCLEIRADRPGVVSLIDISGSVLSSAPVSAGNPGVVLSTKVAAGMCIVSFAGAEGSRSTAKVVVGIP